MASPRLDEDVAFDAVFPVAFRRVSARFWTPLAVARRAAELFESAGARRVLDVGAGCGKFALAAAQTAPSLFFLGVEQRRKLVEAAEHARAALGVGNARFVVADATRMAWTGFDGFYFFNPLGENLLDVPERLDASVALGQRRWEHDAQRIERVLRRAPPGTAIVTYHGAGARIPGGYDLDVAEPAGSDWIRLWIRRREDHGGISFVELSHGDVQRVEDPAPNLPIAPPRDAADE